jgi:ferric-dicitrate binding protein FerR (iron transport regulator)
MKEQPEQRDDLEPLFRGAHARRQPPADVRARVEARFFEAWQERVAARRRRRHAGLAIAATVVLSAGVAWFAVWRGTESVQSVGTLTLALGEWRVEGEAPALVAGDRLETGADGFVTLVLAGGATVRMDGGSRMRLATDRVELDAGRLYVDAGPATASVTVATEYGEVTDIGTQFAVDVREQRLSVAVREGEVRLIAPSGVHRATAVMGFGDLVVLRPGEALSMSTLATTDPAWDWTLAGAQSIDLERISVHDFLNLVAREFGRELVWSRPAVEREARTARWDSGGMIELDRDLKIDALLAGIGFRLLPDAAHRMVVDTIRRQ